jgi:hypothetical protein
VAADPVTHLLAEALRSLVWFVEERPEDATADDDVRALEDVASVLHRVGDADRDRLCDLLGAELCGALGLTESNP